MKKLVTYILRMLILGAHNSTMCRELGIADIINDLPFALVQPAYFGDAISNVSKAMGYTPGELENVKRKGIMIRFVDEDDENSDFEFAREITVYFNDQNFASVLVFADGTNKIIATGERSKN